MKTQKGGRSIIQLFFNLGARLEWMVNTTSRPLSPGFDIESTVYRLGWPQDRSEWVRKIWPPPELSPRNVQAAILNNN